MEINTMAKMIFTLEEVKEILLSNNRIPSYIADFGTENQTVSFKVKAIPIPISLTYNSFVNGVVTLKINKGKLVALFLNKLIIRIFPEKMPDYIKLDYPNIYVDVKKLLTANNINGINVKSIVVEGDSFIVTSCSA